MSLVPMQQEEAQDTWHSLANGVVKYTKQGRLVVVSVTNASTATSATLPEGYRPPDAIRAVGWGNSGGTSMGIIAVQSTGVMGFGPSGAAVYGSFVFATD